VVAVALLPAVSDAGLFSRVREGVSLAAHAPTSQEANGSGVCLIDYDNDGSLNIYLVNGPLSTH
jgi:hypothetical protein